MFVPGVNGSIIANSNAPTGSRLKGAYKNSKKRKAEDGMVSQKPKPNGGSVDIVSTLKQLDPNFNKPKNTVNPVIKEALSSADNATDMLQLGHFSTLPWAQGAALVGDIAGIGVDLAQSGIANYEGNNLNAVGNLAMASAPAIVGSRGYTRSRSMVNNAAPGRYRPTSALTPAHAANPVIAKGLAWNKAALAANVAEMASNIDSRTYATQRVPQRDNTQVIMRPNPNRPIMPNGGSVLSMGDYDKTTAPKQGNYLLPDINRPSYIDESGNTRSEYKMGINVNGKETLIPSVVGGRQLTEDEARDRYRKTGLHMGQFNTPEEADYAARLRTARYNMLDNPIKFQANQFKDGGTLPPRYTSNPNDPRLKAYQDSLYVRRLNPQTFTPGNRTRPLTQDEKIFWKDEKTGLVPNLVEYNPDRPTSGYFGHYKKPVQPYIYKKPEVVPEVVETSVAPIEPPVKKIGYNKPIIQQFNYMSNENKAKALQKYGSVSDIPFKGVDINQLKKGGEVEDDDDKEMVDGVASILRGVKDKKNRLQLANKLAKQFNREKVKYDLPSFLAKSKVKK
jgi:hypothetical protein